MAIDETSDKRPAGRTLTIDLQQLRFAVAASDCGSLRRAADLLSVRHSLLSRSISQLEHLIGATIFERSSGGVRPTLAGKRVLRIARIVLEQVDALVATGRSNGRGEAGRISVGFCTSISAGNLRATLLDFRRRFPHIDLATVERPRIRMMNSLRSGTLDIIVVPGDAPSSENQTLKLWSERILVTLPERHPLAAREVIHWTDLRGETVLLSQHDPSRELEDLMISKLVSSVDRPRVDRHDVSRGIIKSLISMGLGISFVMESDTGASFAGLVYRELRDGTGSSRIDFSAHWRADNENPALGGFLKVLSERYRSPASPE
ncbi:DNA-binding transcriptional LysR family regulator [Bradyrhizobium sp. LM6.10]|uniref:LysR family transcriptional regulator n=1 Tax=unclassified Bradyrhizobium TaxID=2631580 RepID=UPI001FF92D48|nr:MULTISPECIES: LysR family transcriptional regulator [unclassified Bradyrhizobium]MCK1572798.1 LysR family transcriptional regulator [Bradyrhizobium sp. 174]MCK1695312.1 LysR family transcriptional regulator [Bradyrhizobium sp. 144]